MPMRSASSDWMIRPVNISSWARATPTMRGSSHDVPMSHADTPMRTKAALNVAERAARRMSEPSTRANPPPAAAPLTAATTGWGSERRCGISDAMWRCTAKPRWVGPRWAVSGASP